MAKNKSTLSFLEEFYYTVLPSTRQAYMNAFLSYYGCNDSTFYRRLKNFTTSDLALFEFVTGAKIFVGDRIQEIHNFEKRGIKKYELTDQDIKEIDQYLEGL